MAGEGQPNEGPLKALPQASSMKLEVTVTFMESLDFNKVCLTSNSLLCFRYLFVSRLLCHLKSRVWILPLCHVSSLTTRSCPEMLIPCLLSND